MEVISGDMFCCILCGFPSPREGMSPEGILTLDKFHQQLHNFSAPSGAPSSGILSLNFCEECLWEVTLATENGEEVLRVEGEVRRLQQELLRQIHQLCTLLDTYLKGISGLKGKVERADKSQWTSESTVQFRGAIINVVQSLTSCRNNLTTKLILPESPPPPPQSTVVYLSVDLDDINPSPEFKESLVEHTTLEDDEEFVETDSIGDIHAPISNFDPLSTETDLGKSMLNDWQISAAHAQANVPPKPAHENQADEDEMNTDEQSDDDEESDNDDDDPDYIKSEPESSSEYSPSSSAPESDSDSVSDKTIKSVKRDNPSSPPVSPSNVITLPKEVFVPNQEELSKIENPLQRQVVYQKQRNKWHSEKRECPVCHKQVARTHLKQHLMLIHSLAVREEGSGKIYQEKPVSCEHCGKTMCRSNLKSHLALKHGIRTKKGRTDPKYKYQCPHCGKRISSAYLLKLHVARAHAGVREKEETFNSSSTITSTSTEITLRKEKFVPDKTILFQINDLAKRSEERRKQYEMWKRRQVPCQICQKLIKSKGLKQHLIVTHEVTVTEEKTDTESDADDDPLVPTVVTSSSSTIVLPKYKFVPNLEELSKIKDPFQISMKRKAQRTKWFSRKVCCPVCEIRYTRATIKEHLIRKHGLTVVVDEQEDSDKTDKPEATKPASTKKVYDNSANCPECGKTLGSITSLKQHLWRIHNVSNPGLIVDTKGGVICDLCHSRMTKEKLVEHLKEHVGEEYLIRCPNPTCIYTSITLKLIKGHMQKNTNCQKKGGVHDYESFKRDLYTCKECGEVCDNQADLRGHLLKFHETVEKGFVCPISGCEQSFTCRQSVVVHLPLHNLSTNLGAQPCSQCEEQVNAEEMTTHLKEKHGTVEIIRCTHCPFRFGLREHLVDHLHDHRHSQSLSCDICGVEKAGVFPKHGLLVEHYFKEHGIAPRWSCDQCGKIYTHESGLKQHIRLKHKEPIAHARKKVTYHCEDCGQVLWKKESLRNHQIRFHGATPYGCSLCQATFKQLKALQEHKREVHMGVPVKKDFPCPEPGCGASFKSNKSLRYHNSAVHLREPGTHVCEQCGKAFRTLDALKLHRDTVHLKLRNHVCEECGEAFGHKGVLRKHMLIHTGERPFACEICGQRFRHKEPLKAHLKGHDTKGADFKPTGPMKHIRKRVTRK